MPREGSVKRAAPSPSAAEPCPIRRVLAMTIVSIAADASATAMRGSTLAAASPAAKPAAIMPPNDQPACSDDMIGLPRSRSTPTPWLFIETSIVALDAPNRNSPATTNSGRGASTIRLTASASATPPMRVMRCEPCLTTIWPAIGKVRITASDMPRRTRPIALLERSKRSWIHGICATKVPRPAPLTKKTAVVAQRRLMRASPSRRSRGTGRAARRARRPPPPHA